MSPPSGRIQLSPKEFEALLQRLAQQRLEPKDYELLIQVVQAMGWMSHELEEKNLSIRRLQRIFGIKTESSKNLLKNDEQENDPEPKDGSSGSGGTESEKTRKGHGRNGADAYTGAMRIRIQHDGCQSGDPCPECPKGRLYELSNPGIVIRVKGQSPIQATIYDLQKYRCNLCGQVFTAKLPEGVGDKKYDETAGAMLALMRYGGGFPHYRLKRFQDNLGIPLPESTQWDIIEQAADTTQYVYKELIRQAAQGEILHNDDTTMRILSKMKERPSKGERKGVFTTGILSVKDQQQISLYITGNQHAGENIRDILRNRGPTLNPPIQMCDALSRNLPKDFEVILANCMTHGRRHFADLLHIFPEKCRYVIEQIAKVYHNDEITKNQAMSPLNRLAYHQQHSKPVMDNLKKWIQDQLGQKQVEPNSSLGKAFNYMLRHWDALTRFLVIPGCPLDNNIVERCLKSAIMHRKNSLFFKTELGAHVGDIFMSIIQTCRLAKVNPFHYLTQILKNHHDVFKYPHSWMPWNYQSALSTISNT